MFTLKVENIKGAVLELTDNEEDYQIANIEGITPPNANINTSTYANGDGSAFNSSKIPNREIVITVYINGDVSQNRLKLYKYFRNKQWCKIYYEDDNRNVFIEGYVQTFEVPIFVQKQVAQISILCPDPYFKDINRKSVVTYNALRCNWSADGVINFYTNRKLNTVNLNKELLKEYKISLDDLRKEIGD